MDVIIVLNKNSVDEQEHNDREGLVFCDQSADCFFQFLALVLIGGQNAEMNNQDEYEGGEEQKGNLE